MSEAANVIVSLSVNNPLTLTLFIFNPALNASIFSLA